VFTLGEVTSCRKAIKESFEESAVTTHFTTLDQRSSDFLATNAVILNRPKEQRSRLVSRVLI